MILVTGATGTIGGELVGQLIDARQPVRVLVRDVRKVASIADRFQVAAGDLDRPETLPQALQGVKAVFLVTFETSQDASMLEAARRAGAARHRAWRALRDRRRRSRHRLPGVVTCQKGSNTIQRRVCHGDH